MEDLETAETSRKERSLQNALACEREYSRDVEYELWEARLLLAGAVILAGVFFGLFLACWKALHH